MKKKIKDLTLVDLTKIKNIGTTPLDCLDEMNPKDFLDKYGEVEAEINEKEN